MPPARAIVLIVQLLDNPQDACSAFNCAPPFHWVRWAFHCGFFHTSDDSRLHFGRRGHSVKKFDVESRYPAFGDGRHQHPDAHRNRNHVAVITADSTVFNVAASVPGGIRTVAAPITISIIGDRLSGTAQSARRRGHTPISTGSHTNQYCRTLPIRCRIALHLV
jgi:hypothetical protein